jgi:hypothetical protein
MNGVSKNPHGVYSDKVRPIPNEPAINADPSVRVGPSTDIPDLSVPLDAAMTPTLFSS